MILMLQHSVVSNYMYIINHCNDVRFCIRKHYMCMYMYIHVYIIVFLYRGNIYLMLVLSHAHATSINL